MNKELQEVAIELKESSELMEFMKSAMQLNAEQIKEITKLAVSLAQASKNVEVSQYA